MKITTKVGAAAVGVGVIVRQVNRSRVRATDDADAEPRSRWRFVTINRAVDDIAPNGVLPQPLAELGDSVDVRISPAADGKGTELGARLRSREPSATARLSGQDPRQAVRSALRQSKQLLEVGEVLRVDPQPAGHRTPTPTGKILENITQRAGGEGVL
jgi:hypothetical protein